MRDPDGFFASPDDVLSSDFSDTQKKQILRNWEDMLNKRQMATEEGMVKGPSKEPLDDLLRAIAAAMDTIR